MKLRYLANRRPDSFSFLGRQENRQLDMTMTDDNVVDDIVFEELRQTSDLLFLGHSDLALEGMV